jgi:ribosomal-protein-serine acetyltransferase
MSMNTNPILLDIPNQFESTRLILRTPLDGDGSITFPALLETQETFARWFPNVHIPTSIQEVEEYLREEQANLLLRQSIRLLIFRQDTGKFVGESQFTNFDWGTPRCEIEYWVRTSMQKQGFMTEAVKRMTDFGFDVLHMARISIHCDPNNTAGVRVAEKAGYLLEGTLRNHRRQSDGQLADTAIYSMIPGVWNKLKTDTE